MRYSVKKKVIMLHAVFYANECTTTNYLLSVLLPSSVTLFVFQLHLNVTDGCEEIPDSNQDEVCGKLK